MLKRALMVCALLAAPAVAMAAEGFATTNVNLRSGPSTAYPAVIVVPAGAPLNVYGCLAETPWCDVSYGRIRGWMAGRYIQTVYRERRVYVGPEYYRPLGIPIIRFDLDNYWERNYRGRDFYRDRDRWRREWRGDRRGPDFRDRDDGPRWDRDRRGDWRDDRRDDWRDDNDGGNWRDDRRRDRQRDEIQPREDRSQERRQRRMEEQQRRQMEEQQQQENIQPRRREEVIPPQGGMGEGMERPRGRRFDCEPGVNC